VRRVHELTREGDAPLVIEVGVRDGGAMDLGLEEMQAHSPPGRGREGRSTPAGKCGDAPRPGQAGSVASSSMDVWCRPFRTKRPTTKVSSATATGKTRPA